MLAGEPAYHVLNSHYSKYNNWFPSLFIKLKKKGVVINKT